MQQYTWQKNSTFLKNHKQRRKHTPFLFFICVRILTFPLMIFRKASATQVFQQFVLVGSFGLGTTSMDLQCAMPPLLRNLVALCYAPKGPIHPTSASLYSGSSLPFAFSLLQGNSFFATLADPGPKSAFTGRDTDSETILTHTTRDVASARAANKTTNTVVPPVRTFLGETLRHIKEFTNSDITSLRFF
jgi:hypothetical protein